MSYAKAYIIGNLSRDPEMRATQQGTSICQFSIGVNRKFKSGESEKEEVSFFDCEAWGKTAENIAKYFTKGMPIFIECRPKQDTWDDKESGKKRSKVKFVVEQFQFFSARESGGSRPAPAQQRKPEPTERQLANQTDDPDDPDSIPF
jgi:single-strand DNA-binding protein